MQLPQWYFDIFARYKTTLQSKSALYVALSAGVDSNTLLHWLYTFKTQLPPIYTIHVNHNWHDDYSHLWANFAKRRAEHYGFTHYHYEAHFTEHDPRGLEAAGREMRYRKFGETMIENSLLCVGHHRSDQAETLMQRLLRQAGIRGLGAMRDFNSVEFGPYTIDLFRPFLSISKKTLYETAVSLGIPWLEDYTNHEAEDMERNIIRNRLFKTMDEVFPRYEESFYQVTQFMQEADDLLQEIAAEDLQRCTVPLITSTFINTRGILSLPALKQLSPLRQKNLLQAWVRPFNLIFSKKQLEECIRVFLQESPTHHTSFKVDSFLIGYFQNHLYLYQTTENRSTDRVTYRFIDSENAPPLTFWESRTLALRERQGGERFHPIDRDHSQTVKKLLQEKNLPLWEREYCYLLVDSRTDEILWINHLGLSKSLQTQLQPKGVIPQVISGEDAYD